MVNGSEGGALEQGYVGNPLKKGTKATRPRGKREGAKKRKGGTTNQTSRNGAAHGTK